MDWTTEIGLLRSQLAEHYVFPEVAEQVAEILRERLASGAYAEIETEEDFARAVTGDLQSVNGDKHLRLLYSVDEVPEGDDAFDFDLYAQEVALSGHGIARVERLPGNVGYLDTTTFAFPGLAGDRAVAAMTLLADTDALIFDVRRNKGGAPGMVSLFCTYLFGEWPATHLNSIYDRPSGETQQYWTLPYAPGPRFGPDKPIYVLTSAETFSAAEELTYDLQTRGRATVVGERTRGGANPGTRYRVGPHLKAAVPSGSAINPVTGTNWEGVGVTPDIELPAGEAFDHAYALSLKHVLELGEDGYRRVVAAEARQALADLGPA